MKKDPYTVLGVARDASLREIRARYLKLVKELYLDGGELDLIALEQLKVFNKAYQAVKAREARLAGYDRQTLFTRPWLFFVVSFLGSGFVGLGGLLLLAGEVRVVVGLMGGATIGVTGSFLANRHKGDIAAWLFANGQSKRIVRAPGTILRSGVLIVLSKKSFDKVYGPTLSDMREEHAEALQQGRPGWARLVHCRYVVKFWLTLLLHGFAALAKLVKRIYAAH